MAREYERPPLVEAVCEFRFASSQPWDLTIPGLLYGRVQDDYPIKEQIGVVQVTLDLTGPQIAQQTQPGMRFANENRNELIQIAPGTLTVHQLRPYPSWEHFKARIFGALAMYRAVATPDRLTRVGLRYVNRVDLPPGQHELNDYFLVLPQAPEPIPQVFAAFLAQILIPYGPPSPGLPTASVMRLTFGTVPPETSPGHYAYFLDLDMFTSDEAVPDIDRVENWLEIAHTRVEDAFVAAFTAKTRTELFGEVPT